MSNKLPISIGLPSQDPKLAADLGKQWEIEGVTYILLKSASAVAAPAGRFVVWGVAANTSGALAAAAAPRNTVSALVPSTFIGNLAIGDYYIGVREGWALALFAAASAAATYVAVHAGGVDDATVTQPTTVGQTQEAVAAPGVARMRVILDAA